jgi:hypothetical protein
LAETEGLFGTRGHVDARGAVTSYLLDCLGIAEGPRLDHSAWCGFHARDVLRVRDGSESRLDVGVHAGDECIEPHPVAPLRTK